MDTLQHHAAEKLVNVYFEEEGDMLPREGVIDLLAQHIEFSFLGSELDYWLEKVDEKTHAKDPNNMFAVEKNIVSQIYYLAQKEFMDYLWEKSKDWLENVAYGE